MLDEDEIEDLREAIEAPLQGRRHTVQSDYYRGMLDMIAIILGDDEELRDEVLELANV